MVRENRSTEAVDERERLESRMDRESGWMKAWFALDYRYQADRESRTAVLCRLCSASGLRAEWAASLGWLKVWFALDLASDANGRGLPFYYHTIRFLGSRGFNSFCSSLFDAEMERARRWTGVAARPF